jgi:type IV secretory pathway VirB10-like protein
MSIRLGGTRQGTVGNRPPGLIMVAFGSAAVAVGVLGVWLMFGRDGATAAAMSPEGEKLAAKGEARRVQARTDADRLRQKEIGENYEFDASGELLGAPTDTADLPRNRHLTQATSAAAGLPPSDFSRGVVHEERERNGGGGGIGRTEPVDRALLIQSMLAYSTVRSATWASRRPEEARREEKAQAAAQSSDGADERFLKNMERIGAAAAAQNGPEGSSGAVGGAPAARGQALYPATEAPQAFPRGAIGDMRIGGGTGPDRVVRQGKFLDTALVNELRVDLVESPVIAMVSRDFLSSDGAYVLVPAGAKLIGTAGAVQNVQQARVYIKFDRIIFPNERSAYFPVRQVSGMDGMGTVGIPGDVDRHFALQFGAAIMLGVLDGLAAVVQTPNAVGSPGLRDLVLGRTSSNFSNVLAGIIQRYGNVVPTVTVEPGAKMKVFFSEDVRLSTYMLARDLSWVR